MKRVNIHEASDGIHDTVSPGKMAPEATKLRDFYALKPGASIIHREFGYYCLEQWYEQGLEQGVDFDEIFGYDICAKYYLGGLGWCEAALCPEFEEKVVEDRGETEVVQDFVGRHVLYFKNRRDGFMPEYIEHPVKDMKSWEENIRWRLAPAAPKRFVGLEKKMEKAKRVAAKGYVICLDIIGGYMYLRSLIGPEALLYMFYDNPKLLHDCMRAWLELADYVSAKYQNYVSLDEVFFGEDICFNHGPLISLEMMNEFILPYYQQLLANIKSRQLDLHRKLHVQVDTDGFCDPVIDIYREKIGMDFMSPFEVASGCDVVRTAKEYPDLLISGGIDKRVLAAGKDAIDRELERIMPFMIKRGGYIPTCDHGVPAEVSLENYLHYRKRMLEYSSL
jgi:uroporphyrinogen decarboxylase